MAVKCPTGWQPIELAYIYWKAERKDEAEKLFRESLRRLQMRLERDDESSSIGFFLAAIYAVQGNKEEALRWLEMRRRVEQMERASSK
ncbi:MAG: tetratricopeptide repeat protein [Candidatus Aminicenantales bacterium]